jgi:epoxyqueuosine reductase
LWSCRWRVSTESPPPEAVPALAVALNDEEPLVRGHAAWALGRIGTEAARQALRGRAEVEEDNWVREEIGSALRPVPTSVQEHA